jgi:Tol biopolymer transport system component
MTRRKTSLMVTALLIVLVSVLSAQQPAGAPSIDVLMGAAMHQEEVEGNLPAAADIYKRVISDARASRQLQATALLRLAKISEKVAPADARAYYQRLTRDFADQSAQSGEATRRLMMLNPPANREDAIRSAAPGRRHLWTKYTTFSTPSPDGRYVPFVTFDTDGGGSLHLRDLAANTERLLVPPDPDVSPEGRNYPGEARFSPDSRTIAFGFRRSEGYQLRVIGVDGSGGRTLTRNPEHDWITPVGWSPDGSRILVKVNARGEVGQIAWVSVATGAMQTLKSAPWRTLGRVALSPDGRYIAYDLQIATAPPTRTIFLLAADGAGQTAVSDGRSRDEVVDWTPDGKALAYMNYRGGSPELWSLPLTADGKPGAAQLITRDMRGAQPLGFTSRGALLYSQIVSSGTANVGRADFVTGHVTDLRPISTDLVADFGADWSPDGSQIAYVAHRGTDINRRFIAVYSLDDGSTRQVIPADDLRIAVTGAHRFSKDGKTYLVNGASETSRGARAIDLTTGRLRTLLTIPNGYPQTPQLFDGGKSLLFHPYLQATRSARLVIRDLSTGADEEVPHQFREAVGVGFQLSPDEQTIAVVPIHASHANSLHVMPLRGGLSSVLVQLPGSGLWPLSWTPDGRHVIYSRSAEGERRTPGPLAPTSGIWFVPAAGGEPRRLQLPTEAGQEVRDLRVHPDGHRITFTTSRNDVELWSLDNLVAPAAASRR